MFYLLVVSLGNYNGAFMMLLPTSPCSVECICSRMETQAHRLKNKEQQKIVTSSGFLLTTAGFRWRWKKGPYAYNAAKIVYTVPQM